MPFYHHPVYLYDDVFRYDLVHGRFADSEAFRFYRKQTELYGSPVLDLACGTGSLLIPLAESGVEITGIDISDKMLAECERKSKDRNTAVLALKGDMRCFDLSRKFKLVLIAGNSFQHLESDEDITNCLECIKRHLQPGGRLVIEVFNPFVPLLMRDSGKRYMVGEFENNILSEEMTYDPANRTSRVNWHFWDRITDSTTELTFSTREFFPEEMDAIIQSHGFSIEDKFGDFDGSRFSETSPKQIIVAAIL